MLQSVRLDYSCEFGLVTKFYFSTYEHVSKNDEDSREENSTHRSLLSRLLIALEK